MLGDLCVHRVAVKELQFSYCNKKSRLLTIHPHFGNLPSAPQEQPSLGWLVLCFCAFMKLGGGAEGKLLEVLK